MKLTTSKKKISSTVLISMTDVIFLLIIFLLLSSNFASQTGLPVKLPASTSSQRQANQVMHLIYENDESILLLDKSYTLVTLEAALKERFISKEQVVRLSAAKQTELQKIITLMDVIRAAGFERIFVATQRPEPGDVR